MRMRIFCVFWAQFFEILTMLFGNIETLRVKIVALFAATGI
jgi:hypothetical protein